MSLSTQSRYDDYFSRDIHPASSNPNAGALLENNSNAAVVRHPRTDVGVSSSSHNPNSVDSWYLDEIAKYKGEPYYDELLENPYLFSKQAAYTPNALNEIAGAFGFSDGREEYEANLRNQALQWLTEKVGSKREQEYELPVNQVAREAAAGINPSLAPGSISPGEAAENDQPFQQFSMGSDYDSGLPSLASLFMSIFSFASGIAKDSLSMQSLRNSVSNQEIDMASKLPQLAKDYISGHVGIPFKDKSGNWTYPDLSLEDLDDYARVNFRSRSARRSFIKEVSSSFNSARAFISRFSTFKDAEDVKSAFVKSLSGNLSSGLDPARTADVSPMVILTQALTDTQRQLEKLKVQYEHEETEFKRNKVKHDQKVLDNLNPEQEAAAINSGNVSSTMQNWNTYYKEKANKIINKNLSDAADKIDKATSKDGDSGLGRATGFAIKMITSENARKELLDSIEKRSKSRKSVKTRSRYGRFGTGGSR